LIEAEGGSSFRDYSIPEMTLTLRQGLGRLLRSSSDAGLLVIMDTRLTKKGYGKPILNSLPPSPLVTQFEDVEKFMKNI
jgi:ATP-dependent DNA helicase DinG